MELLHSHPVSELWSLAQRAAGSVQQHPVKGGRRKGRPLTTKFFFTPRVRIIGTDDTRSDRISRGFFFCHTLINKIIVSKTTIINEIRNWDAPNIQPENSAFF